MNRPPFTHDVAVAYAQDDDLEFGGVRWVTEFCANLKTRLAQVGVKDVRFLKLASPPPPTVEPRLTTCATLVAILSNALVHPPPWHYGEHWGAFGQAINGGSTRSRLFKVFKQKCFQDWDEGGVGYRFWVDESGSPDGIELVFSNPDHRLIHIQRLSKLAYDVRDTLKELREPEDSRPTVYLTASDPGSNPYFESLGAFLRSEWKVVGAPAWDGDSAEYEERVRDALRECTLAVHLIDRRSPDWSLPTSPGRIQWRVAKELVQQRRLAAIAWAPERFDSGIGPVGTLMDAGLPENFDSLVAETEAGLRARIRERLAQPLQSRTGQHVLLIYHPDDAPALNGLAAELSNDGQTHVIRWELSDDATRQPAPPNAPTFDDIDAAVLCWLNGSEGWFWRAHEHVLTLLGSTCNVSLNRCSVLCDPLRAMFRTPLEKLVSSAPVTAEPLRRFLQSLSEPPDGISA